MVKEKRTGLNTDHLIDHIDFASKVLRENHGLTTKEIDDIQSGKIKDDL